MSCFVLLVTFSLCTSFGPNVYALLNVCVVLCMQSYSMLGEIDEPWKPLCLVSRVDYPLSSL